jgi:hypothetical protein
VDPGEVASLSLLDPTRIGQQELLDGLCLTLPGDHPNEVGDRCHDSTSPTANRRPGSPASKGKVGRRSPSRLPTSTGPEWLPPGVDVAKEDGAEAIWVCRRQRHGDRLTNVVPTARLDAAQAMPLRAAGAQQSCPTRPHEPSRIRPSAPLQCPATRGLLMGALAGIPRWHARGLRYARGASNLPATLPRIASCLTC